MGDKVSSFVLSFDGDAGDLNSVLAAFKSSVRSAVADLKAQTANVSLFENLGTEVQKAAAAFAAATEKVAALKAQIDSIKGAGGTVGTDLAAQFRLAEQAASAASKAYNSQVTAISALQAKLTAAGVNTGKLASEQLRLAEALKVATTAAAQQSAKGLLGFKTLSDVQPQINALSNAFNTLRASGTLSATEIAAAQTLLAKKIAEVKAQVSGLGTAFTGQTQTFGSFITGAQAKLLGFVAAIATLAAGIKSITDEARNFQQGIAQIGAVTNLSQAELAALGEEARALARTIGFDVVDAVKQLGVIIAAGIPANNAISVLAASAEQAKIAQVDLGTEVKLSTTLVNAFGVSTDDLNRVLSIFFQSAKNGGPSIAALADDLGKVGPLAKQTGTPIEEISAALQVMVKAGVPAGAAINDLNQLFVKLNTAAARKELAALGITTTDLAGQLDAIGKSGVPIGQLLGDLGLSSARSVAGVAALTDGSGKLAAALAAQKDALDLAAKAQAAYANTPKERLELFTAAVNDLKITIGNSIGASSKYAEILARIINLFNNLAPSTRDAVVQNTALSAAMGVAGPHAIAFAGALSDLNLITALFLSGQTKAAEAVTNLTAAATKGAAALQSSIASIRSAVASQATAARAAVDAARASFQGFAADLQTQISALQSSSSAALADLNARAAAQIAALDKSTEAEKATADAALAIQIKLAADRLALIVKNNTDILAAVTAAGVAQLAAVAGNAEKIKAVDLSVAQAKLAALGQYKGQLAAALADAVAQEQGFVGKINAIDATRVSFNRDVQDKLDAIRNEGLSDFDQYIVKVGQINKLLADAAAAFQQGGAAGLALGKTYTDQAIALSGTLKQVVNEDGVAVISAFDVQQKKLELIGKAAEQYNAALDDQKAAAIEGKDATVAAIGAVELKLIDITKQYDDLNAKVQQGIALKITTDEADIAKAQQAIDDAVAKERVIKVTLGDLDAVQGQIDGLVENLKKGITEGADAQLQGIADNLKKIATDAPQIALKVDDAIKQIDGIKASISQIEELKPKVTLQSNVGEVQAAIDKLKLPTESTHTVHVVVEGGVPSATSESSPVTGFARGGVVGSLRRARDAWQNFAGGGFTFPALASSKVPGIGNADTVPASLPRGAFVMRKAASNFYGDNLMSRLALGALGVRYLASGGFTFGMGDRGLGTVDPQKQSFFDAFVAEVQRQTANSGAVAPVIDPKKGYQSGDSFQGNLPDPITFDVRQVPANLVTAANVLEYAQEMLLRVGFNNPLLGALGEDLLAMMQAVQANAGDTVAIAQLLRDAETIGANPYIFSLAGKTQSSAIQAQPEWFYDWLEKTHAGELAGASASGFNASLGSGAPSISPAAISDFAKRFFSSPDFGEAFYVQNPLATIKAFASGGHAGTDTVNAMLTPGEYVISRPAASAVGPDFLHAMNSMRFSREDLADIISPPAPRRPPMRFAEGGPVGDLWGGSGSQIVGSPGGMQVNIYLDGSDLLSEDQVRRKVIPVLNDVLRRGKS